MSVGDKVLTPFVGVRYTERANAPPTIEYADLSTEFLRDC
jgi:hypothetical protein